MKPFEIPLSLTVATPAKAPMRTGIEATTHRDSRVIYARLNRSEVMEVQAACEVLGIAEGTFVRHAVTGVAHALLREYSEWKDKRDFEQWRKEKGSSISQVQHGTDTNESNTS